jgi:hypothetical protein
MKPIAIYLAEKLEDLVANENWLLINNAADELRKLQAEVERLKAAQPAPSQYGSPELQAMVVARAIEKDRAAQPAPWVGLTLEDKRYLNEALNLQGRFPVIEAIEAKLREKNGGAA